MTECRFYNNIWMRVKRDVFPKSCGWKSAKPHKPLPNVSVHCTAAISPHQSYHFATNDNDLNGSANKAGVNLDFDSPIHLNGEGAPNPDKLQITALDDRWLKNANLRRSHVVSSVALWREGGEGFDLRLVIRQPRSAHHFSCHHQSSLPKI